MASFSHLCPECLEVPTPQCAFRACPQRPRAAPEPATVAYSRGAPLSGDATRAVSQPDAILQDLGKTGGHATPSSDGGLATRFVDPTSASPQPPSQQPRPPQDDGLATRFVQPSGEDKR